MTFPRNIVLIVFTLSLAAFSVTAVSQAQDEKKPAAEEKKAEAAAAEKKSDEAAADASDAKGEEEFSSKLAELFPVGRAFFGVKIPNYEGDTLSSVIKASKMQRLDDSNLDMDNLHITMYEDSGEPSTYIEMERAVYNKIDDTLISRSPTRIWQPQYELKGDYMFYDKKTGNVIMKRSRERQVEMTIYGEGGLLPGESLDKETDTDSKPLTKLDSTGS